MKIAMIGQKGIPARAGGVERHVEELSAGLAKQGHEVIVFSRAWYTEHMETYRGVRCIETRGIHTKHLDAITHSFTAILRAAREKADVFHIHGGGPALLAWLPRLLRPRAKVIVTFHGIDRRLWKWGRFAKAMFLLGEWCACRLPDATIAVSRTLREYAMRHYGADAIYIPNGAPVPTEIPGPERLERFGLRKGRYLLMCARLAPHKNANLLMDAWQLLRERRPELVGDMKLAIVGGSSFTDEHVRALELRARGDHSIVMTGTQVGDSLLALFGHAYAQVHPSEFEGLPISILEGMSHGRCVLSADIPESLELVQDHGLQFRTGDVHDLSEKMEMMLEEPELVHAVGRDARAFVAHHFDWRDVSERVANLYESMAHAPEPELLEAEG